MDDSINSETIVSCSCCGSPLTKLFTIARVNGHHLVQSPNKNCGFLFEYPQPSSEQLMELYSDYHEGTGQLEVSQGETNFADELLVKIQSLKKGGSLLDIGCSYGYFLDSARKLGYETYGVEIADEPCEYAKNHLNLKVFCGTFEQANIAAGNFDIVVMVNVLEHLSKPDETLKQVFRVMRRGGTCRSCSECSYYSPISVPTNQDTKKARPYRFWERVQR